MRSLPRTGQRVRERSRHAGPRRGDEGRPAAAGRRRSASIATSRRARTPRCCTPRRSISTRVLQEIAHPLREGRQLRAGFTAPGIDEADKAPGPKYVGCASLRQVPPRRSDGLPVQRLAHEPARRCLGGARARRRRREMHGAGDDPQQNPACLKCHDGHASAQGDVDEGVGCEACHGPGSEYMADAVMRDPKAARKRPGFANAGPQTCCPCHRRARQDEFRRGGGDEEDRASHASSPPADRRGAATRIR